MKKLFGLSFLAIAMTATMSAMNSPAPAPQKTINITTATPQDSAWPEPGNPVPPYDK